MTAPGAPRDREVRDDRQTSTRALDALLDAVVAHDDPPAELERACAQHPGQAAALRRRYRYLHELGLLDATPEVEERFGPYRLIRLVGGTLSEVYLAEREDGTRVALKVLRFRLDGPAFERFAREGRALSRLRHPSICPVHEVGAIDGAPFLCMEWLTGGTLAAWLVEHRPDLDGDWRQVVRWAQQLASALHAAHQAGFVHRDVKPHNVMLVPGDRTATDSAAGSRAVLLDFGLAHEAAARHALTVTGEVLGTPPYMAPEQVRGGDAGAATTDVYALGSTLYECLTGTPPFVAATREELFRRVLEDDPEELRRRAPWLPRGLAAVVHQALAKDPGRRYPTAAALADDLRRVADGARPRARRPGAAARVRLWMTRNRAVSALAGVLTAAVPLLAWQVDRATSEQRRAERIFDELGRLSAGVTLPHARREARRLRPAWPERVPDFELWLRDHGEPLTALWRDLHAVPRSAAASLALRPGDASDTTAAFLRGGRAELTRELTPFAAPGGTVERVRERLAWARSVRAATLERHARAWAETTERVRTSPAYGGLELAPQIGLIPLGQNPVTGLFEFYHLRSGAGPASVPAARRPDGGFDVRPETGIVFVLLPGGEIALGAQGDDPSGARYVPGAWPAEGPPHAVRLAPFFVSKYETTQAQWRRLTGGDDPSYYRDRLFRDSPDGAATHPVERVHPLRAATALGLWGLSLPTEAQWEYACRSGSDDPWSTGALPESLIGHANLGSWRPGGGGFTPFPDGHEHSAPVGSFAPNGFGLYDVHGNVSEWCRERYVRYDTAPTGGDGFRPLRGPAAAALDRHVMHRGGSLMSPAFEARSAFRADLGPSEIHRSVGVRAVRAVH